MNLIILLTIVTLMGSCSQPPSGASPDAVFETENQQSRFRVETVAGGLEVPWGLAFLPGGNNILFTERPGRVRMIENGRLVAEPVFVVPDVEPSSESGL